jgi:glycogen operon protein
MEYPPVVWGIELSEQLANTKVIAEPWDAGGLYDVGRFPGARWSEWNGRFRDDVRKFIRGDGGMIPAIATRIAGSADIYQGKSRGPMNSVNFITAHDGFTLYDLVSYNQKHNDANGEDNRDGVDDNISWNCGWEGEKDDPGLNAFRRRQIKNFAAILFLSQGTPMFVAGDEIGRTQGGNNNAYCQDNEISWIDWTLAKENAELFRFFSEMIGLRRRQTNLQRRTFMSGAPNRRGLPDIAWHGIDLDQPDWNSGYARVLAFTLAADDDWFEPEADLHVMLNMDDQQHDFAVPSLADRRWTVFADTAKPSPHDIHPAGECPLLDGDRYPVEARSIVILASTEGTDSEEGAS